MNYKDFYSYRVYEDGQIQSTKQACKPSWVRHPEYYTKNFLNIAQLEHEERYKFLTPSICHKGYCRVQLSINGCYKSFLVHRLVGMLFIPNPDNKPQINHKDSNKQNNHFSNLEWVTNQENMLHYFSTKV